MSPQRTMTAATVASSDRVAADNLDTAPGSVVIALHVTSPSPDCPEVTPVYGRLGEEMFRWQFSVSSP